MTKRTLHYIKQLLLITGIYGAMFLIIFFSAELSDGIKQGIEVSLGLVIPSLFVFMIFSNIVIRSKLKNLLARPFRFIGRRVFRIGDHEFTYVLLSLIGGYPIGAKLLGDAVQSGSMSAKRAENMLCYCVNCSPAFLISGVGVTLFSNYQAGLFLLISQSIACLLTGFILSFFQKSERGDSPYKKGMGASRTQAKPAVPVSSFIVNSVNDAVKSLSVICGFIVAFSALMPVTAHILERSGIKESYLIQGFLEVITGASHTVQMQANNALILICMFTAFGGLCVHLQILAMVHKAGIRMRKFFLFRFVYMAISVSILKLLLNLMPDTAACFTLSQNAAESRVSFSPMAIIFMTLLSIMLLFFSRKPDKIKT